MKTIKNINCNYKIPYIFKNKLLLLLENYFNV